MPLCWTCCRSSSWGRSSLPPPGIHLSRGQSKWQLVVYWISLFFCGLWCPWGGVRCGWVKKDAGTVCDHQYRLWCSRCWPRYRWWDVLFRGYFEFQSWEPSTFFWKFPLKKTTPCSFPQTHRMPARSISLCVSKGDHIPKQRVQLQAGKLRHGNSRWPLMKPNSRHASQTTWKLLRGGWTSRQQERCLNLVFVGCPRACTWKVALLTAVKYPECGWTREAWSVPYLPRDPIW